MPRAGFIWIFGKGKRLNTYILICRQTWILEENTTEGFGGLEKLNRCNSWIVLCRVKTQFSYFLYGCCIITKDKAHVKWLPFHVIFWGVGGGGIFFESCVNNAGRQLSLWERTRKDGKGKLSVLSEGLGWGHVYTWMCPWRVHLPSGSKRCQTCQKPTASKRPWVGSRALSMVLITRLRHLPRSNTWELR